ncbi:hypothetical protein AB0F17_62225 [Nonomuraea sp. NPDC026600]|uniref:hypothetical protein n=1 Tax=Nonomuraea sp. NPDC026600 TaxID=3155363 RepID=UPI0033E29E5A
MDGKTWNALVGIAKDTHTELMRQTGTVIPPTLFALKDGQLLGYVRLRGVYVGEDARGGIAEMSTFAAAAAADEIVVAWETQDIAVACDLVPLHPDSAVNVLAASRRRHWVYRYPYAEQQLPGRTEHGQIPCQPRWLPEPPPVDRGELEPSIEALMKFSFEPFDGASDRESAAYWLEEHGYTVRLTNPE